MVQNDKKICPIMSRAAKVVFCKKGRCMIWPICKQIENFIKATDD